MALQILLVHGAFDLTAAEASAQIRAVYALGLVPALALRSLVAGFQGRGDTRTSLRLLIVASAVNIPLKIALAPTFGAVGLALATSVGISLYALLLFRAGRTIGFVRRGTAGPWGRVCRVWHCSGPDDLRDTTHHPRRYGACV